MRAVFRIPASFAISAHTTSADVDGWDSLSHAVFIMQIEREFGVELPLEQAYSLANLGALAELLEKIAPS